MFVFIVAPILFQPNPDRFKVNDILRRDRWHAKLDQQVYSDERLAVVDTVMNAITSCRTGFMGSHLSVTGNGSPTANRRRQSMTVQSE